MTIAIISSYLEDKIIEHIFRGTAFGTPPSSVYLALFTDGAVQDKNNSGTEVSGNNYSRKILTSAFDTPSEGATSSTSGITMATPSANWGNIRYLGIFDALTDGNLLFFTQLATDKEVLSGKPVIFNAGDLDLDLGVAMSYYLANKILDHWLNAVEYNEETSIWMALYNTVPDLNNEGGSELSGNGYSRIEVHGSGSWTASSSGSTTNLEDINFGTASGDWGTIRGASFTNLVTSGNILFVANYPVPMTVYTGDSFIHEDESIIVSVD